MKRFECKNASEGMERASKSMGDSYRIKRDGTGRERASKRVLRAWEKVWRGSVGSVHQRRHKLVDSYNTKEDR